MKTFVLFLCSIIAFALPFKSNGTAVTSVASSANYTYYPAENLPLLGKDRPVKFRFVQSRRLL